MNRYCRCERLLSRAINELLKVAADDIGRWAAKVFLSVTVIVTSMLLPHSAIAEDYRWWRDGETWFISPSEPQSPAEHCQYRIAKYKFVARPSGFSRADIYSCNYDYSDGTGGGTAYRRRGDSCPPDTAYNSTTGMCANDQEKGSQQSLACVGNPINVSNGNKYQVESDFSGVGLSTLNFIRTYNSLDGVWRHNHSTYLRVSSFAIALVLSDGRESFFSVSGSTITASPIEFGKLTKTASGWLYNSPNNEVFSFDATGQLVRWANATGAQHLFARYADGRVVVTDNLGQTLSYTEDALHQPLTLGVAGQTIKYDYNASQRLIRLARTRGGQVEERLFHYEYTGKPNLLTGITDERGVRFATWIFDYLGRATSSEHAGGVERSRIAYNSDGSRTVTNEFGKRAIYSFVTVAGVRRVSAIKGEPSAGCPMSNSTFTYDTRGQVKTKTDNKGNVTTYSYNTRGLEISRTEASGTAQSRTMTTTWHATLNLPLTVTEPGRVTTYTYDAQGRQLSQASAAL